MTANEYQKEAIKFINTDLGVVAQLNEAILGLNGEAGECADILKKYLYQGHSLDERHLIKELGDVAWYLAIAAYSLNMSLEGVFRENVNKLRKRYPNGFDENHSINRATSDI